MSIRILIDMNLSPDWVDGLSKHGWTATHWSTIGDAKATDQEILEWARNNNHIVFTHDLDFGTMLALLMPPGQASFKCEARTSCLVIWRRLSLQH